jgi:hypothetical protein
MTGSDYCLGNNVLLNSRSTCNIGNAESRFDLKSFRPPREEDKNTIFASDTLILIVLYRIIRLIVQTKGFPNGRVITIRDILYVSLFYISVVSLKFLNQQGIY